MTTPTTTASEQTKIIADERVPTITIMRDFDAPRERVFQAWTDPDLVTQWLGPRSTTMTIDRWDLRRGGSWAYTNHRDGQEVARFYGCFHDVREPERLVQTFTWEGDPDGVALETLTLEELPHGLTRTVVVSLVDSFERRDGILSGGMDTGVREGYQKLDELLARQA